MDKYKKVSFIFWISFILILVGMGYGVLLEINKLKREVEISKVEYGETEKNLRDEIEFLEEQVRSSNKSIDSKEIIMDIVNNNREIYSIRNEILFRNKEIDKIKASYQALYIYNKSSKYGVDSLLIVAIGIVESELSHTRKGVVRKSNAGAVGIMQLTPVVEKMYGVNSVVFEENVLGSIRFISDLLKQYNGDITAALGHYNGGSNPYYKIRNYSETRNYVNDVERIYEILKNNYR